MKKQKVLFLSAANSIHTIRWVNALCKNYEVHLVFCKNHLPSIDSVDKKVVLHELKYKSPVGYYLNAHELRKIYKNINPDVINVHYASGYGTLARVSKLPNVLLSIWGSDVYDFPNESRLKKRILEKNVLYAKYIASTSNCMASQLKKVVPNLNKKIYITPFGVNTSKFCNLHIKKDDSKFIIGNVKTLEKKYGIEYLILGFEKLYNELKKENKNLSEKIELHIYGDGSQREYLFDLIRKNHLEKKVFLLGKIPNTEVPNKLNEFDIFCSTSVLNSESFGVAVVEAMACELPVVATDTDGFKEVMVNKETGFIVEKENVDAIKDALKIIITDKKMAVEIGKNGRKRVLENYDWQKNVKYMEKIYNEIVINNKEKK